MSIRSREQFALLTDYDPGSAYSEAYQTLYANIRFNWDSEQSKPHTLLIATPSAHTEQAAVAANVAIAAAQSGTPTILVDADLHTPSLQQRFGLGKSAGLHDLLSNESMTAQNIESFLEQSFIPGLRLLGAGTPTEGTPLLLSSKIQDVIYTLRQFLAETETKPGLIIFTCSPVLSGPAASLISALVEQTLLTIKTDRTTRSKARQAQEQLQRAHGNIAGLIVLDA